MTVPVVPSSLRLCRTGAVGPRCVAVPVSPRSSRCVLRTELGGEGIIPRHVCVEVSNVRVTGPLRVANPVCVLPRRSSNLWRVKDGGARRLPGTGHNRPVWFLLRERRQPSPFSSAKYQADTPLYEPTPSPFGDYGQNGSLFSDRAYPSRSPALDPARAGLSRCRGLRVKRGPALGPSCGAGPGREGRA